MIRLLENKLIDSAVYVPVVTFVFVIMLHSCSWDRCPEIRQIEYFDGTDLVRVEKVVDCKNRILNATEYYMSGALKKKYTSIGDTKHGPYLAFYESGALRDSLNYVYGNIEGKGYSYYEDGSLKSAGDYRNGLLQGQLEIFDRNSTFTKSYSEFVRGRLHYNVLYDHSREMLGSFISPIVYVHDYDPYEDEKVYFSVIHPQADTSMFYSLTFTVQENMHTKLEKYYVDNFLGGRGELFFIPPVAGVYHIVGNLEVKEVNGNLYKYDVHSSIVSFISHNTILDTVTNEADRLKPIIGVVEKVEE